MRSNPMALSYDIVFLSMTYRSLWQAGVKNRAAHIYDQMRQHPEVGRIVLVDVLPHTWLRAGRVLVRDLFGPPTGRVVRQGLFFRMTELDDRTFHLMTVQPIYNEDAFMTTLLSLLDQLQIRRPILWSYLPTYVGLFERTEFPVKVFEAVDDWTAHPQYRAWRDRLAKNYGLLDAHAGAIFTVSQKLLGRFPTNRNAHWIPNAVDTAFFKHPAVQFRHPALQTGKPVIVYAGVVQQRVDIQLLTQLAAQRPQYEWVVAGPVWKGTDVSSLEALPNVHCIGAVPYAALPSLLAQCTVGIVPHRDNTLVASMDPLKVYEYLAAGLPVVTTHIALQPSIAAGVAVAPTGEAFLAALDRAVQHPPAREELQALVGSHTWSSRFSTMWKLLPR